MIHSGLFFPIQKVSYVLFMQNWPLNWDIFIVPWSAYLSTKPKNSAAFLTLIFLSWKYNKSDQVWILFFFYKKEMYKLRAALNTKILKYTPRDF